MSDALRRAREAQARRYQEHVAQQQQETEAVKRAEERKEQEDREQDQAILERLQQEEAARINRKKKEQQQKKAQKEKRREQQAQKEEEKKVSKDNRPPTPPPRRTPTPPPTASSAVVVTRTTFQRRFHELPKELLTSSCTVRPVPDTPKVELKFESSNVVITTYKAVLLAALAQRSSTVVASSSAANAGTRDASRTPTPPPGDAAEDDEELMIVEGQDDEPSLEDAAAELVLQYELAQAEDAALDHEDSDDIPPSLPSIAALGTLHHDTWVILMCHGGYFAGGVYTAGKAVVHRAFHRYVVRKGQGGRQSNHDRGGGSMSSAGSLIRRHHEKKWIAEVQATMSAWSEHLSAARIILVTAPGPQNMRIVCYPGGPVQQSDGRVRRVPINTHRPVFEEVQKIYNTLSVCDVAVPQPPEDE